MLDTDDLALWYALNRLITNYWADVDDEGGRHAHEFYMPEALYTVGNNRFDGVDKIRAFYGGASRGPSLPVISSATSGYFEMTSAAPGRSG